LISGEDDVLRFLTALPAYPGGKRRLLGRIFKHLPRPAEVRTFVDAFLGGGSVSLMAKARGYRVLCNDLAERAYIVGRALVENSRVTLSEADTLRLFVPHPDAGTFVQDRFGGKVLTVKHAAFLDNALAVARSVEEPKRSLLLLLIMKFVLRQRPAGNFGARRITRQMEAGEWNEINPNYLRDGLIKRVAGHPKALLDRLRVQIDGGVFSNGQQNKAHQMDAVEFLQQVQGDVAYFDPPYSGTTSYETALRPLDEILAGHPIEPERSRFSSRDGLQALADLLDQAGHFPIWVLSYGNAEASLDDVVRLVEKFRPVQHAEAVKYVHCTGLASEEHRERNRELLIVARRKPWVR
jgi:adenine-specific DNA methylase